MNKTFLDLSGWAIALISLIVNVLQLLKNNDLKKRLSKATQHVGDNSEANQQTHSGHGDNINVRGNARIK